MKLCIDILNKQKCHFSKTGQEDKTGSMWGLAPMGGGGHKERAWEGKCSRYIM
jgi:hypothetical protein